MRQRIFHDKDGNLCGEFPHDAEVGFIPHKRGLRRRLVSAAECKNLSEAEAMTLAFSRHAVKEKEIREKQFVKDESKTRAEYERKNITIKDATKVWLDDVKTTLSKKTHTLYSKTIEIYLANIENHRLQDFNRAHNMQFFTALETVKSPRGDKGPITLATQNTHMRQLSNFLHWAYKNEYLDRIIELKKARVPQKDMEVFSIKQLQTLKAYLLTNIGQNDSGREKVNAVNLYRAFMLATSCLMRSGAIYAQELKNIDLDKRIVKIRDVPALGWKNKASKWPNKPINDNFYEFLVDDLKSRGPKEKYFLDNGHGKTWYAESSAISKAMSKACKAANLPEGVKPFHWGMRAALITYLLNNGETPQKVQQLADHADIQTTMKYYNTREASQREAVARLPTI